LNQLFLSIFLFFWVNNISDLSADILSHALHLSTFEVTINSENQQARVRLRVFQDDFRDAIKNANPDLVGVANEAFLENRQNEIERYFQEHFQLSFDNKNSPISLTNSQAENDVYWFHFTLIIPEKWQKCTLQADYLIELFDDQSNIGTVILDDKKQFFRFAQRDTFFEIALPN
jgi:hypothetical protein